MKRLHQALDSENAYGQVAYDYNEEEGNGSKIGCDDSQSPKRSEGSQEEDQAFVPPPDLEVPEGIELVGKMSPRGKPRMLVRSLRGIATKYVTHFLS